MTASTKHTDSARPAVSDLDAHLGFWLRFVSNHVSAEFQQKVNAAGVTVSEWVALRHLLREGGDSMANLVATLNMTKGAVSKIVTRLEEKGFAERAAGDADRRTQLVMLTGAGRAIVPKLARLADQNDETFFGHLPPAKRAALVDAMQEIVRLHQLKQLPID